MKFKVSAFSANGFINERKINWIKEFREQTGCGLKEAKDVADWVTNQLHGRRPSFLVLDTKLEPQFQFLINCALIEVGRALMIERIPESGEVPVDPSEAVLKSAAIKLIRMGSIDRARDVLKILI